MEVDRRGFAVSPPLFQLVDSHFSSAIVLWVGSFFEQPYVHGHGDGNDVEVDGSCASHVLFGDGYVTGIDVGMGENPLPDNGVDSLHSDMFDCSSTRVTKNSNPGLDCTAPRSPPKRLCPWGNYESVLGQGLLENVIKGGHLCSEIEGVVVKVEKALVDLPSSSNNKKLRRSVSMATDEVREFTKKMEEAENVEGSFGGRGSGSGC